MTKRNIVQGELILTEAGLRRMKSTPVLASMVYDTSMLKVGSNIISSSMTSHGRLKRMFSSGDNHISYKIYEPIIEVEISDFQNENAKANWGDFSENQCCLCGKKTDKNAKAVHYLTSGKITNDTNDNRPDSQGMFLIGSECAKKLPFKL